MRTAAKLCEYIEVNPKEVLKKGIVAKKISMDKLQPFNRDVLEYEIAQYSGGTKFKNRDTIMARITPCLENGKTAMVNILGDGEVGFGSTEFIVFRAKENYTIPDFVYYLVTSQIVREPAIKSMVGSSGRQRVQIDVIKNLMIYFPKCNEQEKISSILRSIDDKIELNNKINNNLEKQAQAVYSSLFTENPNPNWEIGKLSDIIEVKYGKDHKKLEDGIYPVYGSGGIMRYVERPLYTGESVLIPRKGTLNNVMYVNGAFWSVDTMFYTEMLRSNVAKFVYHFVKNKNLVSLNAGSAVPSMTTNILNAMQLRIPDNKILQQFEDIVSPMYEIIHENNEQSSNLASLRNTLLPKLMSGELDVSSIEI